MEVTDFVNTKEETRVLLKEIDILLSSIYSPPGIEETAKTRIRESTALFFADIVGKSNQENRFREIRTQIEQIEYVELHLSFEPSEKTVLKLRSWLKENASSQILLDIHVGKDIVGGAQITYKGKYKDYSLARRMDESKESIKEKLLAVLE